MPNDPFQLERFVTAQQGTYERALRELGEGAKRSHWIWFIFPQVAGLGWSSMATRYAIQSRREAVAYLAHSVLGTRLRECTGALLRVPGKTAEEIMGYPDDLKLRSSWTLFAAVSTPGSLFHTGLDAYFEGVHDPLTLDYLATHE